MNRVGDSEGSKRYKSTKAIFLSICEKESKDPGVSIKIEVASGLDRVTDCMNKGPLVPFSRGGRGGLSAFRPRNFFSVLGTKCEDKRACFSFKKI